MSDIPRPKVLYLDDQAGNLTVFRANMRRYVDMVTTTDPEEAMEHLRKEEFPIIISDQRMEQMSGATFLTRAREIQPDSQRMLLTAYSDFEALVEAINDGQVARFIRKPWERDDMLATLVSANELYWNRRENQALTAKLLHRERLAAIGQVTAGLVHELGNMANKLSVASEIEEYWKTGEDLTREFEILMSGVTGIQVLLETLRLYSKGGAELVPQKRKVELNGLVDHWMTMLKLFPHVRDLATLAFERTEPGPIEAIVDTKMIEQVMVNLVKNGAEAAGEGGVVTLTVRRVDERVLVEVVDNGPGITPEIAPKIWDAFYSTKGDHGTGLGLMMCQRIIEAHEGRIGFENLAEGGCCFTIDLPAN